MRELGGVYYRVSVTFVDGTPPVSDWFETEDAALIAAKIQAARIGLPARVEEVRVMHEVTPRIR